MSSLFKYHYIKKLAKDSYTVASGDTLSAISKKFNVPVSTIAENNKITNPNLIYAGQSLNIPQQQTVVQQPVVSSKPQTAIAPQQPKITAPQITPSLNNTTASNLNEQIRNAFDRVTYKQHLWNAENAAKVGYDESTDMWDVYDDNGEPARGPGIRTFGNNDPISGKEMESEVDAAIDQHLERAVSIFPRFYELNPKEQMVVLDQVYMGLKPYKFYKAALEGDLEEMYRQTSIKNNPRRTRLLQDLLKDK